MTVTANQSGENQRASRRRHAKYRRRTTAFVELAECSIREAVTYPPAELVYYCGRPPAARTITRELVDFGVGDAHVYLEGHYPMIVIGRTRITFAGTFYGDECSPRTAELAHSWLDREIRRVWRDDGAGLLATPATTGRDLWLRTIPSGPGFPVLDDDLQALIRSTSGQGRIETMPGRGRIRELWVYDARLAYLGVTRGLPIGVPELVDGTYAADLAEREPFTPARWLVTFAAPDGWNGPGILPARARSGELVWEWPRRSHEPTWVDGAELHLARQHGWRVGVLQGLVWPRRADPFRTWQDRLIAVLAAAEGLPGEVWTAVRSAVRAIVLHTIGSMHGATRLETRTGAGEGGELDEGARNIRMERDGSITWAVERAPAWPECVHPEWTSAIWARARVRLLSAPDHVGALHLPAGELVGFRTDAIYTTRRTRWEDVDDGRPGRYRLEGAYRLNDPRGWPWPERPADLLAMREAGGRGV